MITVYYDGKCGLCAREIAYYRRIAPSGAFDWRDVAREPDALAARGISQADALRLLHAEDASGRLHIGVDAFVLMWRGLRYWRIVAAIVGAPIIRPIADAIYRRFADWRFQRHPHCRLAADGETA